MTAFVALLRREYLEHRGAFLYAPLVLIVIVTGLMLSAFASGHARIAVSGFGGAGYHLFDTGYFALGVLWWGYLFVVLFFYFADAFNSDWRNNSMLFWKSMPQSDVTILMSKLVAGLTVLPALIYLALLLSGLIAAAISLMAPLVMPGLDVPDVAGTLRAWGGISVVALAYLVLGLLWYAPFFAWVGALSTAFGRWSVPLALLIPVVFSMIEGVVDFEAASRGGYLMGFLRERLSFSFDTAGLQHAVLSNAPLDVPGVIGTLVSGVNWPSLLGGLVFAVAVVYAAGQYRRRALRSIA